MKTVTMREAKTHLSRLISEVLDGEEVVVARGKTPLVRLVPFSNPRPLRRFGTAAGLVSMAPDFDSALVDFDGCR